ncbi:MAG: galactokinase [Bacteroidetes bacterium]|nr:galactokinase [Bacteroidota bacterium]
MNTDQLIKVFKAKFSGDYAVFSAPGRINIIGEHTDYNNGFVLPGAIDKTIDLVIKINHNSNIINVIANDLKEEESITKDTTKTKYHWTKYILGVVCELTKLGCNIPGFDCVFGGNVPVGSGMSSSAALESAVGLALNELLGLKLSRIQLAKAGQMAEHNYVGVRCGIMDQFASLFGEKGKLVKLDCRSLEYEMIPFNPENYSIVLMDTRVSHSLASSEYNKRRASCEEGVGIISAKYPEVKSLRDVTFNMLEEFIDDMQIETYKRCLYVIGETVRMQKACDALKTNDFITLGNLMFECHDGLQLLYEVSCKELDFLVYTAGKFDGAIGSRMMGGGFGGCTISLVETAKEKDFIEHSSNKFKTEFGYLPHVHEVKIAEGARRII